MQGQHVRTDLGSYSNSLNVFNFLDFWLEKLEAMCHVIEVICHIIWDDEDDEDATDLETLSSAVTPWDF